MKKYNLSFVLQAALKVFDKKNLIKLILGLVVFIFIFILTMITYLNWPGKYSVSTCLKSEKGHFIVKVDGLNRLKGVYFISVIKSNYSSGPYAFGDTIATDIREFEGDTDFTITNCSAE